MFLKKTLHNPAKKPSSHKAELHTAISTDSPPRRLRSFARATARVTKLWAPAAAPAAAPAFGKLVHAGGCGGGGGAFAQRVRPGRCRLTARVFARRFAQWQRVQRSAVRSGHA